MKTLLFGFGLCILGFAGNAQKQDGKPNFGKNIISFMPLYVITNNHVGVGASYERLANEYIGIRVPVAFGINTNYMNIGLEAKLYPARNNGVAKYAIAPMIMFGMGEEKEVNYYWNPNTNQYDEQVIKTPRSHFGFILNQTFNFTIMQNFYIGMDGGLGVNYYDDAVLNSSGNSNMSFLAQFQILMGVRF